MDINGARQNESDASERREKIKELISESGGVMKKIIVLVMAMGLVLVGFAEKVMAAPVPISAQEGSQLNALAVNDGLLTLKAGGSFPNAPKPMEAREESSLRNLEAGSPALSTLKAGDDGAGTVLVWVIVICVCVVLLRVVGIL